MRLVITVAGVIPLIASIQGCQNAPNLDPTFKGLTSYTTQLKSIEETESALAYNASASRNVYMSTRSFLGEPSTTPSNETESACFLAKDKLPSGKAVFREQTLTDARLEALKTLSEVLSEAAQIQKDGDAQPDPTKTTEQMATILKDVLGTFVSVAEAGAIGGKVDILSSAFGSVERLIQLQKKDRAAKKAIEELSSPKVKDQIAELSKNLATTFNAAHREAITNYNTWWVCSEAFFVLSARKANHGSTELFLYADRRAGVEKDRRSLQEALRVYQGDAGGIEKEIRDLPDSIQKIVEAAKQPAGQKNLDDLATVAAAARNLRKQVDAARSS